MSTENNLPDNPNINVEGLKPFKKLCITIGTLPSSYMEAMSYQELLLWLCDYLKNTVIPAIDNNANAVTELQNLYIELKNYVDNYFTNLDVQEEINNKLDEMALDGSLQNILQNVVFTTTPIIFENLQVAKTSAILKENFSFQTLGYYNKNDKGNGLYNCVKQQFFKTNDLSPVLNKDYYILQDNSYIPVSPSVFESDTIYYEGLYTNNNGTIIKINDYLYAILKITNGEIIPEQFGAHGDGVTDDSSYLQNLLNFIDYNYSIKLVSNYLINSTLFINNPDAGRNRKPIFFFGKNNCGFIKNNGGFLFSANSKNNGDLFFENVYFESQQGLNTKIFDCDNIIRTKLSNCYFRNVDCILYATSYVQSFILDKCTINGGLNSAIDIAGSFDLTIKNCLIENRENFFNHSSTGDFPYLHSTFINTNCIENLSGFVAKFGKCRVLEFSNNYMEYNNYDIEFLDDSLLFNVIFENNTRLGEKMRSNSFIKWRGTLYSVFSKNNYIGDIPYHDTTNVDSGFIISDNDMISPNVTLENIGTGHIIDFKTNKVITSTNQTITPLGVISRIQKTLNNITLSPNEERTITVEFDSNIALDDIVSVQLLSSTVQDKVGVLNTIRLNNNLYVFVKNFEDSEKPINALSVTILKPYISTTG